VSAALDNVGLIEPTAHEKVASAVARMRWARSPRTVSLARSPPTLRSSWSLVPTINLAGWRRAPALQLRRASGFRSRASRSPKTDRSRSFAASDGPDTAGMNERPGETSALCRHGGDQNLTPRERARSGASILNRCRTGGRGYNLGHSPTLVSAVLEAERHSGQGRRQRWPSCRSLLAAAGPQLPRR
jgi:hypothetical protein